MKSDVKQDDVLKKMDTDVRIRNFIKFAVPSNFGFTPVKNSTCRSPIKLTLCLVSCEEGAYRKARGEAWGYRESPKKRFRKEMGKMDDTSHCCK